MLGFLRRNGVLLTSGFLLLLSLLLVSASTQTRAYHDPVARLLLDGVSPLQASVTWIQRNVSVVWDGYVNVLGANKENQALREQVAELQQQAARLSEVEHENQRLSELLAFRARLEGTAYGARVIGRDPLPWFRTMFLDRGEADGIRRGMAVLAPSGVVGQIAKVSRRAAQVMVLTDNNSGIDAIIQRSRARGIVQGGLEQGCHMKYLRRAEDVVVGDRVVTSGLDGIFPKGIVIGEVSEVALNNRGLLQVAVVQPSAPLESIEEVVIVDAAVKLRDPATPANDSSEPVTPANPSTEGTP